MTHPLRALVVSFFLLACGSSKGGMDGAMPDVAAPDTAADTPVDSLSVPADAADDVGPRDAVVDAPTQCVCKADFGEGGFVFAEIQGATLACRGMSPAAICPECVGGTCELADVDCDGDIDLCDLLRIRCAFLDNSADCCGADAVCDSCVPDVSEGCCSDLVTCGACTNGEECAVSNQSTCQQLTPSVYGGDDSECP